MSRDGMGVPDANAPCTNEISHNRLRPEMSKNHEFEAKSIVQQVNLGGLDPYPEGYQNS